MTQEQVKSTKEEIEEVEKQKEEEKEREIAEAKKNGEIIPLCFDDCFKSMFGDATHLETSAFLISKILGMDYDKLKGKIVVQPNRVVKAQPDKKDEERDLVLYVEPIDTKLIVEITYDAIALNNLGDYFLNDRDSYVLKILRDLYYLSASHGNSLASGEGYDKLKAIFLIEFNPYFIDRDHKEFYEEYHFRNKYGHILTENFKIININIVECKKLWYYNTYKSDEYDTFHKDLILLGALMSVTNMDDVVRCLGDIDATLKIKELIKGVIINMNNNDDAWGRWYDRNEENERMAQSNLDFAHKQGVKEGIELNKREIVIAMNASNEPFEKISKYTNLSFDEIETIINNQDNNN